MHDSWELERDCVRCAGQLVYWGIVLANKKESKGELEDFKGLCDLFSRWDSPVPVDVVMSVHSNQ